MPATDGFATEIGQLQGALASGELIIRSADGKQIQYRTVAELRSALAYYNDQARALKPEIAPTTRTTYASFYPVF